MKFSGEDRDVCKHLGQNHLNRSQNICTNIDNGKPDYVPSNFSDNRHVYPKHQCHSTISVGVKTRKYIAPSIGVVEARKPLH